MKTITLTRDGEIFAIVDDVDYNWLSENLWCLYNYKNVMYARRTEQKNGRKRVLYMHREIAKRHVAGRTRARKLVDHRDSNGLNNQRANLRWATARENRHNQNGARWRHMTDLDLSCSIS